MRLNLPQIALGIGITLILAQAPARAQRCSDLDYREEAQQLLNRSSQRFAHLDTDGDGVACGNLPSIGSIDVDPWALPSPVLLGDRAEEIAGYFEGVVVAGDSLKVAAFLDYHDLTTKWRRDYTSALRPLWASCSQFMGPGADRGAQVVCVALDDRSQELDDRIFDEDYKRQVAIDFFNLN